MPFIALESLYTTEMWNVRDEEKRKKGSVFFIRIFNKMVLLPVWTLFRAQQYSYTNLFESIH